MERVASRWENLCCQAKYSYVKYNNKCLGSGWDNFHVFVKLNKIFSYIILGPYFRFGDQNKIRYNVLPVIMGVVK